MLTRLLVRGFTLVEALVALVLMLMGLAGAGIVLGRSIQYERESGTRRMAIRLAGSLAEELRALDREPAGSLPADTPALRAWTESAIASLPADSVARVDLVPGVPAQYRITIEWPVAGIGVQRVVLPVTT
ncbi:MAG TPA: prepilin-type N-terminal cleavage/methylation domain-containing protein [Steroidobacteraceae bacterium]|nr:prepilin-type N-terminal cleavage/methylation domain-containing protein [Steroidobacteraceae bacterium]